MATRRSLYFTFFLCFLFGISHELLEQQTIDKDCDPSLSKRLTDCPTGYCCVRDEFLPTYVYCKKMGLHNEDCTTRTTESACPCVTGLTCRSNIHSATFHSLYGKCHPSVTNSTVDPAIAG